MRDEHRNKKARRFFFALYVGFFAGLLWGVVTIIAYYLGFTKIIPAYLAEPFYKHDFLASWAGHGIGWLFFTGFSILAALFYALVLYRVQGPWPGLMFGAAVWLLLFGWIGPAAEMTGHLRKLDTNSIVTELCIYLMWGLFIGYTIAYEFTEERKREPFSNFDEA